MLLRPLTREFCERSRVWRNMDLSILRTPYFITKEMQEEFYKNVVCNRNSGTRHFSIHEKENCVGVGSLSRIEWENGIAEIGLIISPTHRGKGYGRTAVYELLRHAFFELGLHTVYGECYYNNEAGVMFWQNMVGRFKGYETELLDRKFSEGELFSSMYFSFSKEGFRV